MPIHERVCVPTAATHAARRRIETEIGVVLFAFTRHSWWVNCTAPSERQACVPALRSSVVRKEGRSGSSGCNTPFGGLEVPVHCVAVENRSDRRESGFMGARSERAVEQ